MEETIVQWKLLNMINLGQTETDNLNRMITKSKSQTLTLSKKCELGQVYLGKFDHKNQMKRLSISDHIKRLPQYIRLNNCWFNAKWKTVKWLSYLINFSVCCLLWRRRTFFSTFLFETSVRSVDRIRIVGQNDAIFKFDGFDLFRLFDQIFFDDSISRFDDVGGVGQVLSIRLLRSESNFGQNEPLVFEVKFDLDKPPHSSIQTLSDVHGAFNSVRLHLVDGLDVFGMILFTFDAEVSQHLGERLNAGRSQTVWRHSHVIKFSDRLKLKDQSHRRFSVAVRPSDPTVSRGRVRPRVDERYGLAEKSVRQKSESVLQTSVNLALLTVVDILQEKVGRKFVA